MALTIRICRSGNCIQTVTTPIPRRVRDFQVTVNLPGDAVTESNPKQLEAVPPRPDEARNNVGPVEDRGCTGTG